MFFGRFDIFDAGCDFSCGLVCCSSGSRSHHFNCRPRNFLCARCKIALPGFAQPQLPLPTSSLLSLQPPFNQSMDLPVDVEKPIPALDVNGSSIPQPLSPSHARKRKIPVKRTIVRPMGLDAAYLAASQMETGCPPDAPALPSTSASTTVVKTQGKSVQENPTKHSKINKVRDLYDQAPETQPI